LPPYVKGHWLVVDRFAIRSGFLGYSFFFRSTWTVGSGIER